MPHAPNRAYASNSPVLSFFNEAWCDGLAIPDLMPPHRRENKLSMAGTLNNPQLASAHAGTPTPNNTEPIQLFAICLTLWPAAGYYIICKLLHEQS